MSQFSEKAPKVLSVSELNFTVRKMFEQELPALWIEGEISNFARPASGHWYFSLKDEKAQIRCAMFRGANTKVSRTGFHPENGDQVILKGKVSLYEPRGDYQFIAEHMEESGSGALQKAYELLKAKLHKEGLFAQEHKQALPELPKRIGVITSASGAALQDILNVLARRLPLAEVTVYPSLVQGESAAPELRQALNYAIAEGSCDCLIIGRGGGSLEDLWAFNDEQLARDVFNCPIPIISAVGHEVDFTILDFVADERAPTPSAAAELATPITIDQLYADLQSLSEIQHQVLTDQLTNGARSLEWLQKRLSLSHPGQWLQQQQQKLDIANRNLTLNAHNLIKQFTHQYQRAKDRLSTFSPEHTLEKEQQKLNYLSQRLASSQKLLQQSAKQQFQLALGQLHTLSPLATLARGYSITQKEDHYVVTHQNQVTVGETLITQLSDGKIKSSITEIES